MTQIIKAELLTIGDEILYGQIVDTNSQWMSVELDKVGIKVIRKTTVGDQETEILTAFAEAEKRADIVLITGGLGPTSDDLTKPLLAKYFNCDLVMHQEALAEITAFFKSRGREMTELNRQQAALPSCCTKITNPIGTAPGMWFERNNKVFMSMPGVPHEMKRMMRDHVLPRLKNKFELPVIHHQVIRTIGQGESFLAEMIEDIENNLPPHIKLAYLPNYGMVRLRLSGWATDPLVLEKEILHHFGLLKERVAKHLIIDEDIPLEKAVGQVLIRKNATVTTAESCTGGYIAHLLTSHAGSSAYYKGSIICYDNPIKTKLLGVTESSLQEHGAVSASTVEQMATTARLLMEADYAIAVSGIMGPGGATAEKPIGLVWIAVATANGVQSQEMRFRFDRKRNIELTAAHTLRLLYAAIVDNK